MHPSGGYGGFESSLRGQDIVGWEVATSGIGGGPVLSTGDAGLVLPVADVEGAWRWLWTNLYGRIVGLTFFSALVPTFLRLHCRPEGNPWNLVGWERKEWFWAVDFSLAAWVGYFGSIAESFKDSEPIPQEVLAIGLVLTILTAGIVMWTERNGWFLVPNHQPLLRLWRGVIIPNMAGFLCIVLAMFQVTRLHH